MPVEYDETPNNVHALFPGIETAPFGRAAALDELSDEGWSTTPEPTLAVEDQPGDRRPAAARRYSPRMAPMAAVLIAVLAGAGLGAGRALLTPAGRRGSHYTASELAASELGAASAASHSDLARASARHPEFVVHRTGQRSAAHHETSRHVAGTEKKSRRAAVSSSAQTVATPSEQPATVPVVASTATYSSGAGGGNDASSGSSSQSAQPAGPRGRVALIGAGTTPSG
jgi:hypothetical protein